MSKVRFFTWTALVLLLFPHVVWADTLARIRQRGTLRWGGDKSGGAPYIIEAADGALTGFEVELAEFLAKELGVHSEFVQGEWEKLPEFLKRGDIDIVLNGYEWSAEREPLTPATVPYYIYRLQLLTRKNDPTIRSWEDLRVPPGHKRRQVGVLLGSAAERYMEKEFGAAVILRPNQGVTNVMRGVEQGHELDATVQDVPIALYYAADFPGLHSVGAAVAPGYYVILTRKEDGALRDRLNQALRKGIQDGSLRQIYEKYRLWNPEQEKLGDIAARPWPPPAEGLARKEGSALDHGASMVRAAGTTVLLSCLSMPLAMLVGLLVAVGRLYGPRWLGWFLGLYVEFLRGTPLLLQLYFIYFLLPSAGIFIPALWAGVLGLALNYSAYEAENYRAGLLAIPRGQMEAALSLGMTRWTALRRVVVPQAVRIVIPPVTNDFIALFKDTSVCSVIAVIDLTGRYNQLYNHHPRTVLEFSLMAALLYLAMSYPLALIARRLERRFPRVVV